MQKLTARWAVGAAAAWLARGAKEWRAEGGGPEGISKGACRPSLLLLDRIFPSHHGRIVAVINDPSLLHRYLPIR